MSQLQQRSDQISQQEKLDWLRLSRTENVGPVTFYRLVDRFGSAGDALEALPELSKRGGRKKPLNAPPLSNVEAEYETLQKLGGEMITAHDDAYPLALASIDDAPPIISVLGNTDLMNRPCVAIVGARNASLNGKKYAQRLAQELGACGQVITSGLARGIDTAAHNGSLSTGTIAVVAGGIDVVYPEENTGLYEQIKEQGLVIAESPLGVSPQARHFPKRNRIVSGLSSAAVIVEATMRSGSLITARMAGEQGRDIYAVPGHPLDPRAQGPNHLIREGATLIRNAQDVLEGLRDFTGNTLREPIFTQSVFSGEHHDYEEPSENAQETILSHLSFTPIAVDELVRACHVSIPVLQTVLLDLELAGRVKRSAGNKISLLEQT